MPIMNTLKIGLLVDELTWSDQSSTLSEQWRVAYSAFLKKKLYEAAEADATGILSQVLETFEADELELFIFDPRVSWLLIDHAAPAALGGIRREVLRVLDEQSSAQSGEQDPKECAAWREIIIDTKSLYDCPPREPGEEALARLPNESALRTVSAIKTALTLLMQMNPSCECFVRMLTTRIVVREDRNLQSGFASGSFRNHAGMSLIVNPDVVVNDSLRLIDGIVHEAIHSALYMYEPMVGRLVVSDSSNAHVRSCWSGRILTADQFVQACFVWWGLMNLWAKWVSVSPCDAAERLLSRAARGFLAKPATYLASKIDRIAITELAWDALNDIEKAASAAAIDILISTN